MIELRPSTSSRRCGSGHGKALPALTLQAFLPMLWPLCRFFSVRRVAETVRIVDFRWHPARPNGKSARADAYAFRSACVQPGHVYEPGGIKIAALGLDGQTASSEKGRTLAAIIVLSINAASHLDPIVIFIVCGTAEALVLANIACVPGFNGPVKFNCPVN
jgi:hypothetical protein